MTIVRMYAQAGVKCRNPGGKGGELRNTELEMCTCEFKRSRNVTACWRDITVTPREVNITNDLENLQFGPTLGQRRIRWPSVETTCFVGQTEWSHGLVRYISHRVYIDIVPLNNIIFGWSCIIMVMVDFDSHPGGKSTFYRSFGFLCVELFS